ncbi:MAG: TIGR03790 family protein [Lentisphaeria bacterium]
MKTEKPDTYCLSVAYMARRKVKLGFFLLLVTLAGYSYIPASRAAEPKPRYGRVLVVANRLSPASLELASQYCRRRLIPPANILKLSFADQINISTSAFREKLLKPIRERYRKLDEVPDYVVLVRGVPYRTGRIATTTAILFNGSENLRPIHGYFQRLETFDSSIPYFGERLLPATVLSAYNVQEGMELIKRSEVVYPNPADAGTFYFCDGAGPRGSRNRQIESAMAQLQGEGVKAEHVKHPSLENRHDVLAQLTGNTRLSLESNTYLPGSIIDNMTSWGGYLLGKKPHNSALTFIAHGACGAYGTVYEPTNNPRRWAAYTLPLSYARGFNLAESYLQNVRDLKFGTVVGDPLTRPFGKPQMDRVTVLKLGR